MARSVAPRRCRGAGDAARRRRYGPELQQAIFDATLRQLAEIGFTRMTMDSVAAAAGTGKAALYRRWGNKTALVLDAMRSVLPSPAAVPPTANVRDDLLALLSSIQQAAALAQTGAFHAMAAEGGRACRDLFEERVLQPCRDGILAALRRGAGRGEVAARAVDPLIASVGPAMLVEHVLMGDARVSDQFVESVVDRVLMPLVVLGSGFAGAHSEG
jgi:AcrR family transcriptional regulator